MEKQRKKILMIGPSLASQGGMATIEKNIVESLKNADLDVRFVPTYVEGSKLRKLVVALRALLKFESTLGSADIVHVHSASRGSFWRKSVFMDAAFKRGVPVILHIHSGEFLVWYEEECDDVQKRKIRKRFERASRVVLLSEEWREAFVGKGICAPGKVAVLHNAVDVPSRVSDVRVNRDVLFLGRLGSRKSPDVLLRAAETVLSSHPEVRFRFGGDGDIAHYAALAAELGISGNCEFLGWTTGADKEEAIRKSRIYCLPSKHEGMPMSVLEAMSYGLVTISTPVGGVPQVIKDGVNGYLMPIDDSEYLAERINALLDDSDLAERIGREGRKMIQESFSMDAFSRKLIDIYKEVEAR